MNWVKSSMERDPAWKNGWAGKTLASMSSPPMPLLVLVGVVILLLALQTQHSVTTEFKLALLAFTVLLIFVANSMAVYGTIVPAATTTNNRSAVEARRTPPWGVALLLFLLLMLLFYRPYFLSK